MTEEEKKIKFSQVMLGIKSVYPHFGVETKEQTRFWYELLKDIDIKVIELAVHEYITTHKFPPTIADIREMCSNTQKGKLPDAGECWGKVQRAIGTYGMYREEDAMNSFDDMTRQCVKRLGWKQLCLSENTMADRAHFLKIFEQVATREKKERQVPLSVAKERQKIQQQYNQQIQGIAKSLSVGE